MPIDIDVDVDADEVTGVTVVVTVDTADRRLDVRRCIGRGYRRGAPNLWRWQRQGGVRSWCGGARGVILPEVVGMACLMHTKGTSCSVMGCSTIASVGCTSAGHVR